MTRVLYIDDEPDLRAIVAMALELEPELEVRAVATGREGLAVAAAWRPALILLDVMMPDMDGPATARALRDRPETAAIPIVFMTAMNRPAEVAELRALGARDVIAKPFDPMTLGAVVAGLLAG